MRRLKEVYPAYAGEVAFYVIGSDPTETLNELEDYRLREGHPWEVAIGSRRMLPDLNVLRQDTKVAFDASGLITYRQSYGRGTVEAYEQVFADLAASAQ